MREQTLRRFEIFAGCSDEELRILEQVLRPRTYGSKGVICRQGEDGRSCFFLVEGTVKVYREVEGVGRIDFPSLQPGVFFGQVSLLDGQPRMATCVADGPVQLLELHSEPFRRLEQGRSRFSVMFQRELARSLVRQLRRVNQRFGELEEAPDELQRSRLTEMLGSLEAS